MFNEHHLHVYVKRNYCCNQHYRSDIDIPILCTETLYTAKLSCLFVESVFGCLLVLFSLSPDSLILVLCSANLNRDGSFSYLPKYEVITMPCIWLTLCILGVRKICCIYRSEM